MLSPRHIQDYDNATGLEPHWGYHDRVIPCANDEGTCAYLSNVYESHDRGMLYVGILYSALGGLLLLWAAWRSLGVGRGPSSSISRLFQFIAVFVRRHTLSEVPRPLRFFFGRTTRLQVLLLAALTVYLTIFSFVGMLYTTWVTPVKKHPGLHNTRTALGPFSDRIGIFAYALTPVSILLANRESILSAVTGVPYQHFNFLHRWIGHIIMLQSVVHTIAWTIVEVKLYQPQPTTGAEWIKQPYMIWGVVALIFILLLWVLATSWARRAFGYEFFRKAHWVLAMLFVGACWAHWPLLKCFMIPSLVLWFVDRGVRLLRTTLIHYQVIGGGHGAFTAINAAVTHYESDVVRLDLDAPQNISFQIGQHFYLTFTQGSIWQSHPFTPLSLPGKQSYLIRAKRGETKKLTAFSATSTPVILTGPYGTDITSDLGVDTNVLCIAGGTGITFVLPVLLMLAQHSPRVKAQLVWAVRHARDVEWVGAELAQLAQHPHISVQVFATRDNEDSGIAGSPLTPDERGVATSSGLGRPHVPGVIDTFVKHAAGPTKVYVSGPVGMVTEARDSVARCNKARKVWRGADEYDVDLVFDDRLE